MLSGLQNDMNALISDEFWIHFFGGMAQVHVYIGLLILTADQEMNGSSPQVCILVFLMCSGFIFLVRKNGQMTSRVHRIARRRVRFGTAQQRAHVRACGEGA